MIPGLKSLAKDLEELKDQLPPEPTAEDLEMTAWLESFTAEQIVAVGEIFIRHPDLYGTELLAALNAAEYDLLVSVLVDHPPVDGMLHGL